MASSYSSLQNNRTGWRTLLKSGFSKNTKGEVKARTRFYLLSTTHIQCVFTKRTTHYGRLDILFGEPFVEDWRYYRKTWLLRDNKKQLYTKRKEAHLKRMKDPEYEKAFRAKYNSYNEEGYVTWKRGAKLWGITFEKYLQMVKRSVCDCCGETQNYNWNGKKVRMSIDHDHDTNKVRGLLCMKCNQGIGLLGDKIEGLYKAVTYLRRSKNGDFC
jgi:hypothetical protein